MFELKFVGNDQCCYEVLHLAALRHCWFMDSSPSYSPLYHNLECLKFEGREKVLPYLKHQSYFALTDPTAVRR